MDTPTVGTETPTGGVAVPTVGEYHPTGGVAVPTVGEYHPTGGVAVPTVGDVSRPCPTVGDVGRLSLTVGCVRAPPILGGTAHKAVRGVGEPSFPVGGVGGTTAVVRRATLSLYVVDTGL